MTVVHGMHKTFGTVMLDFVYVKCLFACVYRKLVSSIEKTFFLSLCAHGDLFGTLIFFSET